MPFGNDGLLVRLRRRNILHFEPVRRDESAPVLARIFVNRISSGFEVFASGGKTFFFRISPQVFASCLREQIYRRVFPLVGVNSACFQARRGRPSCVYHGRGLFGCLRVLPRRSSSSSLRPTASGWRKRHRMKPSEDGAVNI